MSIYTVHSPPLKADETAPDPERFVFVRDGFNLWAFLLAPLWMLARRLWLVLLLYVVAFVVLEVGLRLVGATRFVNTVVDILLSLLVGFEAATLQRWTLDRRRWLQLGTVSGNNRETAERRFFDAWVKQAAWRSIDAASPQQISAVSSAAPATDTDIVGLFPEPQTRQ